MNRYLLQHLLEESVARHPDRPAIRLGTESITYRSLGEKSSRLARLLVEAGFEARHPVGVLLEKSIASVIAFFGILKAGGAYISLDLHYSPPERISGILAQSRTRYLVTDAENLNRCAKSPSFGQAAKELTIVPVDAIDGSPPLPAGYDPGTTDLDLAYILYTSGSTGVPKGVMLSHRNALTFVDWSLDRFGPSEADRFANHAPFQFDLSVFDIYVAIACGACLHIVPSKLGANPRALVEWMAENRVTYWYSVPSVWIAILNHAEIRREDLAALTHILFAGEVFPPKYLKRLIEALPGAAYYNLYGPTETNVCTYYRVPAAGAIGDRPVPIGRACENTEVVALGAGGEPVPVGEEGELMVRGATVTQGYYRDPEKTKAAFLKSPLPWHHGALLYKTGDIVRRCDAQNYEYVGRTDAMVKCSGYRIELPEIEHALCQYEAIEEAAVVPVVDEQTGTARLHGFVKTRNDEELSILAVKKHLGALLPKYMVPEVIRKVGDIPKNANGKIDRPAMAGWTTA